MTENIYGPGMFQQIKEANGFHRINPNTATCTRCNTTTWSLYNEFSLCPKAKLEFDNGILFDTNPNINDNDKPQ